MSRYLSRVLVADEKLLYSAQLHWVVFLRGLGMTLFGVLVGQVGLHVIEVLLGAEIAKQLASNVTKASVIIILVGAYDLLRAYIKQISTELVITNRRVIAKYGFIATTTFELMMNKVEGANIDQTVAGRILGYGTILVKGTGGGISPIDHVAEPYRFHAALMQILDRIQKRNLHD